MTSLIAKMGKNLSPSPSHLINMNTKITYQYRDAANYKTVGEAILKGDLNDRQVSSLLESLEPGADSGFIPSQLKMPHLSPVLDDSQEAMKNAIDAEESRSRADYIRDFDHPYHEILEIEKTEAEPTVQISAQEFYEKAIVQN